MTCIRILTLPALLAIAVGLAACSSRPTPQTEMPAEPAEGRVLAHTVREGETLARIADLYYGDPTRAAGIAAENGVGDPSRLAAGSVLELHFAADEYDFARRRATALKPYNLGVSAMARGNLEEAERQFRLALRTVPDLPDARYNLALVLMRRGQAEQATALLNGLVADRPDDADFGFALGNALFQQTRYLDAARVFAGVLVKHPDHRRAAFGYARALQESGSRLEARDAWRRYLQLDADSSWAAEARRHLRELEGG